MPVTLVDGRISRQEIKILATLGIVDVDALGAGNGHFDRRIVGGAVRPFQLEQLGRGETRLDKIEMDRTS